MRERLAEKGMGLLSLALLLIPISVPAEDNGKKILQAIQETLATEGEKLAQSVVAVRVDGTLKDAKPQRTWNGTREPQSRHELTGTILTEQGHILLPVELDPEKLEHLTVWIGEEKLDAQFLASSDKLLMSLIKVEMETKLNPIKIDNGADAKVGECLISVTPTGEDTDFEKHTTLVFNRGVKNEGRYRQFLADFMAPGVAAVNLDGLLVGIVQDGKLLAIRDLLSDIQKLMTKADKKDEDQGNVANENKEDKKPWLGVLLSPINEDYAQSRGYPKGAIWFTAVMSNSAAAKAGLESQDLAVEVNGRPVKKTSANALAHFHKILDPEMGEPFTLKVIRGEKTVDIKGTFGPKPEPDELKADDIGIEVQECADVDYYLNNLFTRKGVLVKDVRPGSPAAVSASFGSAMISTNDVIIQFDGDTIETLDQFKTALAKFRKKNTDFVLLKVYRGSLIYTVGLNMKIGEQKTKGM